MEKQPKALECAEDLARFMRYLERIWGDDYAEFRTLTESEKELRRLHGANAELLAMLQKATHALAGGLWDYGPGQDEHELCNEVIAECRAAIAKATGQQQNGGA